jgi:sugar phosphate isomerase/epimerase
VASESTAPDGTASEAAAPPAARPLILAHFSLRHADFEARVAAAAGAGFDGIGLNAAVYSRMLADGWTAERVQAVLDGAGIRLLEVEALRIFDEDTAGVVFEMVDAFAPLHVQVIAPFEGDVPLGPAGERFAALAERVAPAGTRLAFEFLPFTAVRDAADALAIIEAAGNPANGGLCVDAWHVFRGRGLEQLADIPPERVAVVQFNDGPLVPVLDDYLQDCIHHREVPGEGEFDLVTFLRALPSEPPVSVEVIDDDLDALAPSEVAARLVAATRRSLAAAANA